jgi:hypothetical protein
VTDSRAPLCRPPRHGSGRVCPVATSTT